MQQLKYFLLTKSLGIYINLLSYIFPEKAKHFAYKLFSNPREGKLDQNNLPEFLANTLKETISFDNDYFQSYVWKGNENTILLIHGWESNASRWEKLIPYLQKTGSTVIAIDAPAHGLSSGKEFNVPKYAEYIHLTANKYKPNTIIGHSLGGAASVYFHHRYQLSFVKKIVLLGSPSDLNILINNYTNLLSLNRKTERLLNDYFVEKFNIKISEFSGHHFAKSFQIKGFIVHDKNDQIVLINEARKFYDSWKNSEYYETFGLGHSLHDDNLYNKIEQFVSES